MSYFCVICWTSISHNDSDTTKNSLTLTLVGSEETNASLYVSSLEYRIIFQSFLAVFRIEDPTIWLKKPYKFCSQCGHLLTQVSHLKEELKRMERLIKGEEQVLKRRLKVRTRMAAINSKNEDQSEKNWWEELPDSSSHPSLEGGDDGWNSKETNDGVQVDPVVAHDEDEKTKEKIEEKIISLAAALAIPIEEESGYDSGPAFPSTSKAIIPCQILKRRLLPEEPESRESSSLGSQDDFNESLPKRVKRGEAREEEESSLSSLNLLNSPQNPILLTETSPLRQITLQVASNYEEVRPLEFFSNLEQDQINFDNKDQDERSKLSKGKTISIINNLREMEASQFFFINSSIEPEIINGNKEQQQVSSQDEREAAEILLNLGNFTPKIEQTKETNGPPLSSPKLGDEDLLFTSNIEGNERKGGAQKSSNNSTKKVAKKKLKKIMTPSPSSGTEEPKECPTCSKQFRTPNLLRIHLNAAHKLGNLHRCPICNRPYYGKKAPRRHIWTHYSAQEKEEAVAKGEKVPSCWEKGFMCDQCPSAFTTNSELLKHQKQIHEEVVERQACEKCGSLVKNLAGHMRQSHPKKEDFRFVCLECEEKFINSARLRQHKLSKHGEGKKVKCERCEELFKTRRELTVHVNSKHLKIMPYKCEFCGMAFTRKMSWTRHVQGVHKERNGGQTKKRSNMALNKESRRNS
ncbi:unnamed protein product [Orchesella dallaii]|uniref:C2H2-type domain-containing protein n=1 Tax=Orchesella dallaii TaxID=48710 RepID=A0ABP1PNU2_9HEXA